MAVIFTFIFALQIIIFSPYRLYLENKEQIKNLHSVSELTQDELEFAHQWGKPELYDVSNYFKCGDYFFERSRWKEAIHFYNLALSNRQGYYDPHWPEAAVLPSISMAIAMTNIEHAMTTGENRQDARDQAFRTFNHTLTDMKDSISNAVYDGDTPRDVYRSKLRLTNNIMSLNMVLQCAPANEKTFVSNIINNVLQFQKDAPNP